MISAMLKFSSLFRKSHLPLAIAAALAACGGGGLQSDGITSSSANPPEAVPVTPTTPAPAPTPTPEPVQAPVPTLSLEGVDPIPSGINVSAFLGPSWGTGDIPGFEALGVQGAFRFACAPSHNSYDDPVVYPGQPGRSHLHTFFGNTKADANSTYQSLRTTGESTCNNVLNRSAYWMPAMMNGRGKVVMPDFISIYYKRAPAGSSACTFGPVKACLKIPRGLRYVYGYNMADPASSAPAWAKYWNCDGPGAVSGHFNTIREAAAGCPAGARLGAIIIAPPCWNGKELDSADHRSHMAYPEDDHMGHSVCPATHPYILPFFQIGAWYTNDGTAQNWFLSSDRMAGMPDLEPGTSLHADWFGAWEDSVLDLWTANCIDKSLNCSGGDLGNGQQMKMLSGYTYGNTTTLVDPPTKG